MNTSNNFNNKESFKQQIIEDKIDSKNLDLLEGLYEVSVKDWSDSVDTLNKFVKDMEVKYAKELKNSDHSVIHFFNKKEIEEWNRLFKLMTEADKKIKDLKVLYYNTKEKLEKKDNLK